MAAATPPRPAGSTHQTWRKHRRRIGHGTHTEGRQHRTRRGCLRRPARSGRLTRACLSRWRRQLGRIELRRIKSVHMNERGDELVVVSEGKHRRTVPKKTGKTEG